MTTSVNLKEIEHFAKDSSHWWDENGPFRPLHRINPVRLHYIREQIEKHFKRNDESFSPFKGLEIVDVGCGGGLICEPMARLGAGITGIDADKNAIEVAKEHAELTELNIDYKTTSAEKLLAFSPRTGFDVVLALEIVEHVADPETFIKTCVSLCKPGGIIVLSTINRTPKSFALGIVAAEYILRWVPQGTHSWKKFLRPSELSRYLRTESATISDISGLKFNILSGEFEISDEDIDVNYFITAEKI